MTDAYAGQQNGSVSAWREQLRVGVMDFVSFRQELTVSGVHVEPAHRRQGIATAMYERLLAEFPEHQLATTGLLPDGAAFRAAFDRTHGERLVKTRAAPAPYSQATYDAMIERHQQAARAGDHDTASRINDAINAMHDYDWAAESYPHRGGESEPVPPDLMAWGLATPLAADATPPSHASVPDVTPTVFIGASADGVSAGDIQSPVHVVPVARRSARGRAGAAR